MSKFVAFAGAAAAAVALAAGAVVILAPKPTGTTGGPPVSAATPSPRPAPPASDRSTASSGPSPTPPVVGPLPAILDTSHWTTYRSDRYGFTIAHPSNWSERTATEDWTPDHRTEWPNPGWELFVAPDQSIGIGAYSVQVAPGTTVDAWLAANCPGLTSPCDGIRERSVDVMVDGHPALMVPFESDLQVFSVIGDRMWVLASGRAANEYDSLRLTESFLSTLRVLSTPDTSAWTPYTSAIYGTGQNPLTIAHPADWSVQPATRTWSFGTDSGNLVASPGADHFTAPNGLVRVSVWTVPLDQGAKVETWDDVEAWAQAYCQKTHNTPCTGIQERAVPMCIEHRDCHPAVIVPFQDDVEAFGAGGILPSGMVVVAVWRPETDSSVASYGGSQRLLEGFLSTMGVFPPSGPDNHP